MWPRGTCPTFGLTFAVVLFTAYLCLWPLAALLIQSRLFVLSSLSCNQLVIHGQDAPLVSIQRC